MAWNENTIWIYGITALGAAAIYLLLPGGRRSAWGAGAILGLTALAGLVVLSLREFAFAGREDFYFYFLAILSIVSAVAVIIQTKAIYSALYFVLTVVSTAGLVLLLEAEFLAAALIIIYGGAILVTYLFVIMLAQQERVPICDRRIRGGWWACATGFLLTAAIAGAINEYLFSTPSTVEAAAATVANTDQLGLVMMTRYMVVLQAAGILLLIALVGAVAIVRKRFPKLDGVDHDMEPVGQAGRRAEPF